MDKHVRMSTTFEETIFGICLDPDFGVRKVYEIAECSVKGSYQFVLRDAKNNIKPLGEPFDIPPRYIELQQGESLESYFSKFREYVNTIIKQKAFTYVRNALIQKNVPPYEGD